ncbi:YbaB/EbfC family nucleoid-associated protein [Actinoplanes solisilvae]|uniref:YbaB/EbfC family nucleoid-associated protein n=1 Tax=Actinoplanes solisilvae TaxID=2486853 RepID=UPI0013E38639|nr:YbaB/EbfC family nucleoid-associated protein [Actinoplanes solisilvae]
MNPDYAIEDWAARVQHQSSLTTELSERLQQARATSESHGGDVTVTVDHTGGLAELRLTDQAMRRSAGELSEIILATSRRAQARLAKDIEAMVNTLYGAGSETASFIGGTYAERFPELGEPDEERDRR